MRSSWRRVARRNNCTELSVSPSCKLAMKSLCFLVSFSLAMLLVNAFNTEEHVKRFFRPEHRAYLPETGQSLVQDLEDESAVAKVPQNDESTKCLAVCEPKCDKLDIPDYLTVNIALYCLFGLTNTALENSTLNLKCIFLLRNTLLPHLL